MNAEAQVTRSPHAAKTLQLADDYAAAMAAYTAELRVSPWRRRMLEEAVAVMHAARQALVDHVESRP